MIGQLSVFALMSMMAVMRHPFPLVMPRLDLGIHLRP
jgi:hypothetical protein